tara:strand:+ start:3360 stop:3623 length:264 start_codon:yes stop_codon:yes gene_type:complete
MENGNPTEMKKERIEIGDLVQSCGGALVGLVLDLNHTSIYGDYYVEDYVFIQAKVKWVVNQFFLFSEIEWIGIESLEIISKANHDNL